MPIGYGETDYSPTVYTDIYVLNGVLTTTGTSPAVPYRNSVSTNVSNGMLKNRKTSIAEITDGTSNTVAFMECAGRDERFVSQYTDGSVTTISYGYPYATRGSGVYAGPHKFWRWADPDNGFGVSGKPNNGAPLTYTRATTSWPGTAAGTLPSGGQGNQNQEPYAFHPGGINSLFGDGSVRFIKNTVNLITLRATVTPNGGEVVSADQL